MGELISPIPLSVVLIGQALRRHGSVIHRGRRKADSASSAAMLRRQGQTSGDVLALDLTANGAAARTVRRGLLTPGRPWCGAASVDRQLSPPEMWYCRS